MPHDKVAARFFSWHLTGMKSKLKPDIYVGKFQLGWRSIDLYVQPYESGGWFQTVPGDGKDAVMRIGLDHKCWEDCLEILIHEAHEFNLADLGCCYRPASHYAQNCSDGVIFNYDHNLHTESCARTAYFLASTTEPIRKWYNKVNKVKSKG